jgi:hypothetical protein
LPVSLASDELAILRERVAQYRADKDARRWTLDEILSEAGSDGAVPTPDSAA